jgi:hypothetical protein
MEMKHSKNVLCTIDDDQFKNGEQLREYEEHSNSSAVSWNDEKVTKAVTQNWSVTTKR